MLYESIALPAELYRQFITRAVSATGLKRSKNPGIEKKRWIAAFS
jgi:hypothetical protein